MTNPHLDNYGRRLVSSTVHKSNVQKFLGMADAAKDAGEFESYKYYLQQADRSNQLAEVMTEREASAQEN